MHAHPVFADLFLHSDDELAELLGARIIGRHTMHEWPLSCVQRIALENGHTLVYKSQRPPTVEAMFYERAVSPLLPAHRLLGKLGDCDTMTLDWIDAPHLGDIAKLPTEMIEHGRGLIAEFANICSSEGDALPVYLDVGSIVKWTANARVTLDKLRALVLDGRFASLSRDHVDNLATWSTSPEVLDAVSANPRVTHGDLKGDQVFVTEDGYRVIDWQRPVIAPPDTDLVALLAEQRMDPRPFFDITIIRVFWFLRLCWAVEAQFDLFPDFTNGPFERWAWRAMTRILA